MDLRLPPDTLHWQISGTTFHGQIKPKKRWIWNERSGFSLSMGHS